MNMKIKVIDSQVGYRVQSIVLSDDGSLNATLQLGTITGEGLFTPIAQQGHYLTSTEVDSLMAQAATDDEPSDLRDALEGRIMSVLKQKGAVGF